MEIIPVGIYGALPKAGEASSCYLVISGKTAVALDFGSGSLSAIQKYIDPQTLDAVVLSHLHFDHMCDILPYSYVIARETKIFLPPTPTDVFSLIKNREGFSVGVIGAGSVVTVGELTIEFEPVAHPVETYAIKVTEKGGNSFVYSGDVSEVGTLGEFCKGSKLIICDCLGKKEWPHLTIEEGAELMKISGARVIGTHINPIYDQTKEAAARGIEIIESGKKYFV